MALHKLLQLFTPRKTIPRDYALHAHAPSLPSDFDQEMQMVVCRTEGGIYQRIDENRQLLDTIKRHSPELLVGNPEVAAWLLSQDEFLLSLSRLVAPDKCKVQPRRDYPRKWPRLDMLL
jgi:hypothetical protein